MRNLFLVLFFLSLSLWLPAQKSSPLDFMLRLDHVRNDSVALRSLDSMSALTTLTTKQRLELNGRIVIRSYLLGKFEKAILVGTESIGLANKNALDSSRAGFYEQVGNTYYMMNNLPKAIELYKKAIDVAEKKGLWQIQSACYSNMGGASVDSKDYANAEIALHKSLEIRNAHIKPDANTYITVRLLATLYTRTDRPEKAEGLYLGMIKTARENKDTITLGYNLLYYSNILLQRGDSLGAVKMSGEALEYLEKRSNVNDQIAVMSGHSKNLAHSGKPFEAYTMLVKVNHLLKESFTKDLNKKISEVEVKYKTEQIRREKKEAEESARRQRWIYIFSFSLFIIITSGLTYFYLQRKSSKQKALAHKQKLEALIEGEEKERNRIARDLHDGIVQDLTAIKLKIDNVKNKTGEIDEIVAEVDRATKEVRDIAYQMMPVALREYGLIPALEQLLKKTLTPNNIRFDFETVELEERLPEKIEVCLYRVTQELINNVVKHSKASSISLVVSKFHDNVSLVFEDNGKGFRENEIKKGIGMNSLSSRLEMVNGNLKFESVDGAGTMAIIKIPL